jgi:DNA-binding response OmpR family regulator
MPRQFALPSRRSLHASLDRDDLRRSMRTILVVEDDEDLRQDICAALSEEGFVTRQAQNGIEALLILRERELPDLIILDLIMPTMNGWAFRAQQEMDARLAHIPVIVMSAAPLERVALIASDMVRKPIEIDDLVAIVRAHFLASEPADEVPNGVIYAPLDIADSPPLQ